MIAVASWTDGDATRAAELHRDSLVVDTLGGFGPDELRGILGGNFLRVFEEAVGR